MEFFSPTTWEDALALRAQHPGARAIAGGTDVMVELNFDQSRPDALIDLTKVSELHDWADDGDTVRLGAGVTYTQVISDLAAQLPGLAIASRTVGCPQIRNRGTVVGNLGAASPAGDAHPPLLATGATVEVESVRGSRSIDIDDFYVDVKKNELAADELIKAVVVASKRGPQQFSKIGTRNAMVIAVTSFSIALDRESRTVKAAFGSAAPTPRRAPDAEAFLNDALNGGWDSPGELDPEVLSRFGELVAAAASPIDDVRGTADYRRHALSVMARRTLTWCWSELRDGE